jgi:phosphoglycerol transferase MdoB-like AlkP superfamily enzyme
MKKFLDKNGRRIFTRLFIILICTLLTMAFIEWRFFGNDADATFQFINYSYRVFFYNAILLFFIELIISSFFKRPWTGVGVTFILSIIIMYISVQKQSFRGQPLLPEDFVLADQAGTITKFINIGSLIRMILACLIAFGLTMLLNYLTRTYFDVKDRKEPKHFWNKNLRIFRLVILIVGITGFYNYSDFARNHNGERNEEIPSLNSKFVAWNQMINYEQNGFILGFLYNWSKFELKEPDGYSEAKIAEIKEFYNDPEDDKKKGLEDAEYNIVMVLNESFFDMSVVSDYYKVTPKDEGSTNSMGVKVTKDVTPTIRSLIKNDKEKKNFAIGQMYTIDYGGGTANIEFEADTGMTNYWINTVPYVDLLPRSEYTPSIAQIAKKAGYDTLAIHPFNGGMYKRNLALKTEGFDRFIDENEIEFKEMDADREYVNDRSAYKETMKYLKEKENKTLISLITMQNHAGYGADGYKDRSYTVSGEGLSEDDIMQVEVYAESLHNSDAYLKEFLDELENFDEKTVVIWYGDHAPGILEKVNGSKDKNIRDLSRVTPYFVWANFDLADVDYDVKRINQSKTTLPTTTPNCLTNTLFDLLDVRKPDYMKLLNDVCTEVPILAQAYYDTEAPFKSTTLSNYELFVYDYLGGEKYWHKGE